MNPYRTLLVNEINLHNGSNHDRYFTYPIDSNGVFDKKSRDAINAFFHSEKQRNYKPSPKKKEFLYVQQRLDIGIHTTEISREFIGDLFDKVPIYNLDSIWDFFRIVKYDYKGKKWII